MNLSKTIADIYNRVHGEAMRADCEASHLMEFHQCIQPHIVKTEERIMFLAESNARLVADLLEARTLVALKITRIAELEGSLELFATQNAELQKDKERLDWVQAQRKGGSFFVVVGRFGIQVVSARHVHDEGRDLRLVIDVARAEQGGEQV